MEINSKIYIAGHRGMVGSAIRRKLENEGHTNIITRSSSDLDLRKQAEVEAFFDQERPDYVFLAAAKVGGIAANIADPVGFLYDNMMICLNVVNAAAKYGTRKLLFLGSSCIFPRDAPQPLKEEYLLTGRLEPTNEGYALAKIAGMKYCEYLNRQGIANFVSVMPCNVYGRGDNYSSRNSHVLASLIRRFHEAKVHGADSVDVWGTGEAFREFMYVDDVAEACVFLMNNYDESTFINVGTGEDIRIKDLAALVAKTVGYEGHLKFDISQPEGMPRKLLDVTKLHDIPWHHTIDLPQGIGLAYRDYLNRFEGTELESC